MVFVNGELITPSKYKIYNDNTLYLYITKPVTQINTVQIFVSSYVKYGGVRTYEQLTNHSKEFDEYKIPYNANSILIFRNGYKIPYQSISKSGDNSDFPSIISENDYIEFYEISGSCLANHFDGAIGYVEYGPYDLSHQQIPIFYDTIIELDDLSSLILDNARQGFFIKEEHADGVLMIIDEHFETPRLHCVTLTPFQTTSYSKDEYFFQVPDMKDIVDYLSPYDKQFALLPEILRIFQTIILNEIYDEIQRLRDLRNLSRVDSMNVEKLIKFLGMNSNIHSFNLKQRKVLLDELNNFYRILGTEKSYNFFNICAGYSNLNKIEQLFTYHNSTDITKREYVDFFIKEDCGAIPHVEYIKPFTDYGYVYETPEAAYDYGTVAIRDSVGVDYGYVRDEIKGKWIKWWEWDRPQNCYPTNHVNIEVSAEPGEDNDAVIRKFSDHFYVLASTVLYIHDLTINYSFGGSYTGSVIGGADDNQIIQYGILTAPVYHTEKYCYTSDPEIQSPQLTTGLSNSDIIRLVNESHMSDVNKAKFIKTTESGQQVVVYNALNKSCLLTINVIPEDATVTFLGDFIREGNTITVVQGTLVSYVINKEGYKSITNSIVVNKDEILQVKMIPEGLDIEDLGSVNNIYDENENLGHVAEHAAYIEDLGKV